MPGPTTEYADDLHARKYRGKGESFREAMNRVAAALRDDDAHYQALREVLLEMRFIPAGRVQAAMGSARGVTAINCFVSGTIADSFVEGEGSIMQRAHEAAATMRMGGGIGYDFSTLRPRGSLIRRLQSQSSGPVNFMKIFNEVCLCTASSGHRRGAQMGVMRIDHPDIEEFIHAKQNPHALNGFNVSVAVTDEFMAALRAKQPFALRWGGEIYKWVEAEALWETLMRSTYDWAEPGVLFIDRINNMNNLKYCEVIAASNPCGEQVLPPHGACLLGHHNLVKYVARGIDGMFTFNWDQLRADIPVCLRAMDNVVERTHYPLEAQRLEELRKRRVGVGYTGLANAAEALGYAYGSPEFLNFQRRVGEELERGYYSASCDLALEKGPFPLFDHKLYPAGATMRRLRERNSDLWERICHTGLRNSHLLSIAPTGTISLTADNVSSGVEPVFSHRMERTEQTFEGPRQMVLEDYAVREWGVLGKTARQISVKEHLDVLATAYEYVDSAVSKTCNVPEDIGWEEFKDVYVHAWERGCKGCTTYRVGGLREGMMQETPEEQEEATCRIDTATGRRECE